MKKFFVLTFLLLASTAKSVVETQVEGEAEVYQYVETTVDGQTVSKESHEPGTLELEMKKEGENEPTISFSQTSGNLTPEAPFSFVNQIIEFVRNLLANLMLRFTQHQP